MRNLLLVGTAGLFVAFGAANAYAVPENSPYAVMVPPAAVEGYIPANGPVYAARRGYGEAMTEGRSAYVEAPAYRPVAPGYVYAAPAYPYYAGRNVYVDPDYAPFPFSLLPWNW